MTDEEFLAEFAKQFGFALAPDVACRFPALLARVREDAVSEAELRGPLARLEAWCSVHPWREAKLHVEDGLQPDGAPARSFAAKLWGVRCVNAPTLGEAVSRALRSFEEEAARPGSEWMNPDSKEPVE